MNIEIDELGAKYLLAGLTELNAKAGNSLQDSANIVTLVNMTNQKAKKEQEDAAKQSRREGEDQQGQ